MGLIKGLMGNLIGSYNDREVKRMEKIVDQINATEPTMQKLSDEELRGKTEEFKSRLAKGETLDDLLVEAFAVVREGAVRSLGMRHFDVQMIGGMVLHDGRIAEMKTGEGKTLVATLPIYLNALEGQGVHLITVNDYLASYQKEWMGKLYEFLGLTVGCVVHGVEGKARRDAYMCDITYGTNNEFGFDYLRDNMVVHKERMTQQALHYTIIDEVDSILIDEARTPLIISGNGVKTTDLYHRADGFVITLKKDDIVIDEKAKSIVITDEGGVEKAESYFGIENLSDPENMELSHHINQALRARHIMKRDVDYVVKDGEILIVDEFTGRLMMGRRYSNGLHQAIEAKEQIEVRKESQTLATITLQNYFRMYNKLAGMTGTAKTEEEEFRHIYGMDVVIIPTNKPVVRDDRADAIFKSLNGKINAIVDDVEKHHKNGQPILVGTVAIEMSEYISSQLKKRGVRHEVLNAKHHNREAEIVAQAGRKNSVTIATNMAGRGTDIILGGNAEFMTRKELHKRGYNDDLINKAESPLDYHDEEINECKKIYQEVLNDFKKITDAEAAEVKAAGGLHIIGTERHESRRIDNQLRGRAGRQGDVGSSQFFISLEDDLMRLFISDRAKALVEKMGMEEDMQIEAGILSKSVENAQKKVESRNFGIRKHVLQYDDVINRQREIIYAERRKVLEGEDLKDHVMNMAENLVDGAIALYTAEGNYPEEWNLNGLEEHLHQVYLPKGAIDFGDVADMTKESLRGQLMDVAAKLYGTKESEVTTDDMRELERYVLLKMVDTRWIDHIDAMDQLKQGIGLRAIGQQDPVRAYQIEGFEMFDEMIHNIQEETLRVLYNVTTDTSSEREQVAQVTSTSSHNNARKPKTVVRTQKKIGRNDECPCGSGKKYKKCCGMA